MERAERRFLLLYVSADILPCSRPMKALWESFRKALELLYIINWAAPQWKCLDGSFTTNQQVITYIVPEARPSWPQLCVYITFLLHRIQPIMFVPTYCCSSWSLFEIFGVTTIIDGAALIEVCFLLRVRAASRGISTTRAALSFHILKWGSYHNHLGRNTWSDTSCATIICILEYHPRIRLPMQRYSGEQDRGCLYSEALQHILLFIY